MTALTDTEKQIHGILSSFREAGADEEFRAAWDVAVAVYGESVVASWFGDEDVRPR